MVSLKKKFVLKCTNSNFIEQNVQESFSRIKHFGMNNDDLPYDIYVTLDMGDVLFRWRKKHKFKLLNSLILSNVDRNIHMKWYAQFCLFTSFKSTLLNVFVKTKRNFFLFIFMIRWIYKEIF